MIWNTSSTLFIEPKKYALIIIYIEYSKVYSYSYAKRKYHYLRSCIACCEPANIKWNIFIYILFSVLVVLQSVYNNLVWVLSSVCGNHHNIISFSVCVKKYSSNFILLLTMSWKLIRFVPYVMLDCVLRMTL